MTAAPASDDLKTHMRDNPGAVIEDVARARMSRHGPSSRRCPRRW
jgi:hypothetical protein